MNNQRHDTELMFWMIHEVTEAFGNIKRSIITSASFSFANCAKVRLITERLTAKMGKSVWGHKRVFDSSVSGHHLHTPPVGKTSGLPPSRIPCSQRQADTSVINEEQVTCQWPRFSHFVLNVIYVIDSEGSCGPPSLPSLHIVPFCAL